MVEYQQVAEADRQLRNLAAMRAGREAWFRQMQALRLLPAVVVLKDDDAPERQRLERAATPHTYEIN